MIVLLLTVTKIISSLLTHHLKKRIIDNGPLDENAVRMMDKLSKPDNEILKWGILLLSGGIGLIMIEFLNVDVTTSVLPYGVEAIFLAVGFFAYYAISKKEK